MRQRPSGHRSAAPGLFAREEMGEWVSLGGGVWVGGWVPHTPHTVAGTGGEMGWAAWGVRSVSSCPHMHCQNKHAAAASTWRQLLPAARLEEQQHGIEHCPGLPAAHIAAGVVRRGSRTAGGRGVAREGWHARSGVSLAILTLPVPPARQRQGPP